MTETPAVFDLFFRHNPFQGGYADLRRAGAPPSPTWKSSASTDDELAYLKGLGIFRPSFLDFLRDFRFRGTVTAPAEGTVVFANEPLLTVEGSLAEAQFVETALLNIINFQTLVATKAARINQAAAGGDRDRIRSAPRPGAGRRALGRPGPPTWGGCGAPATSWRERPSASRSRGPMPTAGSWPFPTN